MNSQLTLYFSRHGETSYNQLGLCNDDPRRDVHLTDNGVRQAEQLAENLRHIPLSRIIVSELPRTRQTAEIVNRYHQVAIITEPAINDIRSGFDGLPVMRYQQAIASDRLHKRVNGGESLLDHKQRISHYLEKLTSEADSNLLVIAHEETLRVIRAWFENLDDRVMIDLHFANCELLGYQTG